MSFLKNSLKLKDLALKNFGRASFQTHVKNKYNEPSVPFGGVIASFIVSPKISLPESFTSIPLYKILNQNGELEKGAIDPNLLKEDVIKMFNTMVFLNTLDKILYESQRQGRISFYMTNFGEEATQIGSAAALECDDLIYGQYREAGTLLWRGFPLSKLIDQCYGNNDDLGRGKQMPVHYGSKSLNFVTISSPLATQLPQAVGAAYCLKRNKRNKNVVVCYFGEGAASEGDTHAAFNFASTLSCPVIFFWNNGYAISTPFHEQYKGDGIAGRAASYGIASIRVDGTDLFAVFNAMKEARNYVLKNNKPLIYEAINYRIGHHSTSDDSSSYRSLSEVDSWNTAANPIDKLRNYIIKKNWWNEDANKNFIQNTKKQILDQIVSSEKKLKPTWKEMFQDVYYQTPKHLQHQMKELEGHVARYKEKYPLKNFQ